MTIVASDKLEETLESSEVPVLVYFSATWCGPCRVFRPRVEALAENSDKFVLVDADVDEDPGLAEEYGVRSVPTVVGFYSGDIHGRFVGVKSDAEVNEFIEGLAKNGSE